MAEPNNCAPMSPGNSDLDEYITQDPDFVLKEEPAEEMTIKEEEDELVEREHEVTIKVEPSFDNDDHVLETDPIELDVVKEEPDDPGKPLKPYECHTCHYKCRSLSNLEVHIRSHTGEKPFACDQCDYRAGIRTHLANHKRIHTGERPFECKFCGYRAYQLGNLLEHEKIHRGIRPYKCDYCEYRAVRRRHLTAHLLLHKAKKPFKCETCDYRASNSQALVAHARKHTGEKPFKCDYCNYRASQRGSVNTHMKTHKRAKTFKCEHCDYRCNQESVMKTHQYTHTGKKPFSCYHCGFSTSYKPSLAKHIKLDHTGHTTGKPFKMERNENEFGLSAQPRGPVKRFRPPTQSMSGSFICSLCQYTTSHKSSFARHLTTRHRESSSAKKARNEIRKMKSASDDYEGGTKSPEPVLRDLRKRTSLKQPGRYSDYILSESDGDEAVDDPPFEVSSDEELIRRNSSD